jgi:hypothetical protein
MSIDSSFSPGDLCINVVRVEKEGRKEENQSPRSHHPQNQNLTCLQRSIGAKVKVKKRGW